MNVLPNGWTQTTVKELKGFTGLFVDGDWVESKDQDPTGKIRLLQLADIGDGAFLDKSNRWINEDAFARLRCTELATGDVLIARMPDPLGRACLMPSLKQRCVTVVDVAALRVDPQTADNRWVMHTINSPQLRTEISTQASGTTRKRISRGNLGDLPVPLPPAAEQKRIADKLDTVLTSVDAVNARLARVVPLLKRFRQSVLAAATSGRLTEDWRSSQDTEQSGWQELTIGAVASDLRYGTSKKCDYSESGTGVLRIPNISGHGKIDLTDLKKADFDQSELQKLSLQAGDLLVIRSNGSVDLVGKVGVVDPTQEGLLFAGYLMRLRVNETVVLPRFAYFSLTSPQQRVRIEQTAKSTSGVNNINSEELRGLPISLPPLDEQAEIVRRVETLFAFADRLEARLQAARTAAERLTPALLAKAFRGELVPQDPNDEPAAELLKRLAASAPATTKRRGRPAKAA